MDSYLWPIMNCNWMHRMDRYITDAYTIPVPLDPNLWLVCRASILGAHKSGNCTKSAVRKNEMEIYFDQRWAHLQVNISMKLICFWIGLTCRAISISDPMWHLSQINGLPSIMTLLIFWSLSASFLLKPFSWFRDRSNSCWNTRNTET